MSSYYSIECYSYLSGFLSGFSAREGGRGQISILKVIGGWGGGAPLLFSLDVQVSLKLLCSMHITTSTSISAYMDLLATRCVQVHASIWSLSPFS